MARYINADVLKECIKYYYSHTGDQRTNAEHYAYGVALKEIDRTPTADVEEVVRCEKCKFRGTDDCPRAYYLELAGDYVDPTEDDDFCSYGERRTDNDTL